MPGGRRRVAREEKVMHKSTDKGGTDGEGDGKKETSWGLMESERWSRNSRPWLWACYWLSSVQFCLFLLYFWPCSLPLVTDEWHHMQVAFHLTERMCVSQKRENFQRHVVIHQVERWVMKREFWTFFFSKTFLLLIYFIYTLCVFYTCLRSLSVCFLQTVLIVWWGKGHVRPSSLQYLIFKCWCMNLPDFPQLCAKQCCITYCMHTFTKIF